MEHSIPDIQLIRILLGEAEAGDDEAIRAIATDPTLAARVAVMQEMLTGLNAASEIEHLFEVAGERLSRLATATLPGADSGMLTSLTRIAKLVFDSHAPGAALAGFRGQGEARNLRFELEGVSIELQVTVEREPVGDLVPGVVVVVGRLDDAGSGGSATLRSTRGETSTSSIGADGFFEFQVATGAYALHLEFDGGSLDVPELVLGME
jgi:hypothetical protein